MRTQDAHDARSQLSGGFFASFSVLLQRCVRNLAIHGGGHAASLNMDRPVTAADLETAIEAQYGAPGPQQAAAVAFLVALSDAATPSFAALLASTTSPAVAFYAANALYSRLLSRKALSAPELAALEGALWGALTSALGTPPVRVLSLPTLRRVCLGIAAGALRNPSPDSLPALLQRVADLAATTAVGMEAALSAGSWNDPRATPCQRVLAVCDILKYLAEEGEQAGWAGADGEVYASDTAGQRIVETLLSSAPRVLGMLGSVLEGLCRSSGGCGLTSGGDGTWACGPTPSAVGAAVLTALFQATGPWLQFGTTLGELASLSPSLLAAPLTAVTQLRGVEGATIVTEASRMLVTAAGVQREPREPWRDAVLARIMRALVEGKVVTAARAAAGEWDALRGVASLLVALCENEPDWFLEDAAARFPPPARLILSCCPRLARVASATVPVGDAPLAIDGVHVGTGVLLADLVLDFASLPNLDVAGLCVDALAVVRTCPMAERHPYLRRTVSADLLAVLATQVCLTRPTPLWGSAVFAPGLAEGGVAGAWGAWPAGRDGYEAALSFRADSSPLVDAVDDCASVLRARFVTGLLDWLRDYLTCCGSDSSAANLGLEAVLLCLHHGRRSVSDLLGDEDCDPDGSGAEGVAAVVLAVCGGDPLASPLALTACRWLKCVVGWEAVAPPPQGLPPPPSIRYRSGPPFSPPHPPGVEGGFGLIAPRALLESVARYLIAALRGGATLTGPGATQLGVDSLARLGQLVSGRLESGQHTSDEEGEGISEEDRSLSDVAGETLSKVLGVLAPVSAGDSGSAIVEGVASALLAAVDARDPPTLLADTHADLLLMLAALSRARYPAGSPALAAALTSQLLPVGTRLAGVCAALGGAPSPPQLLTFTRCCYILCRALADAVGRGEEAVYTPVLDAVWPLLDAAVPRIHASAECIAAALALYRVGGGACGGLTGARLLPLLSNCAALFDAHLYDSPLRLVRETVAAIRPDRLPLPPAEFTSALSTLTRAFSARLVGAGSDPALGDSLAEYFGLLEELLNVCPEAVAACLPSAISLLPVSVATWHRPAAKAGASFLWALNRGDLARAPGWTSGVDAALDAVLPGLVARLLVLLGGDAASVVAAVVADMVHTLLERGGARRGRDVIAAVAAEGTGPLRLLGVDGATRVAQKMLQLSCTPGGGARHKGLCLEVSAVLRGTLEVQMLETRLSES